MYVKKICISESDGKRHVQSTVSEGRVRGERLSFENIILKGLFDNTVIVKELFMMLERFVL